MKKESIDELIDALIATGRALFRAGRMDWLSAASDLARLGVDLTETHHRNRPHVDRLLAAALDAPDARETEALLAAAPPVIQALALDRFESVLRTLRACRAGGVGLAGQQPNRGPDECIRVLLMKGTPESLPPIPFRNPRKTPSTSRRETVDQAQCDPAGKPKPQHNGN